MDIPGIERVPFDQHSPDPLHILNRKTQIIYRGVVVVLNGNQEGMIGTRLDRLLLINGLGPTVLLGVISVRQQTYERDGENPQTFHPHKLIEEQCQARLVRAATYVL